MDDTIKRKNLLLTYYDFDTHILSLPYTFNDELINLPPGIKEIIFVEDNDSSKYSKFNKNVDHLPNTITHIKFGKYFNNNVDNLPDSIISKLPKSATHLVFGRLFDKNIDNLPTSLINLTLGHYFDKNIDNLPNSIMYLTLGYNFNQIINKFPSSLVEFGFYSNSIVRNNIPDFIENIVIYFDIFNRLNNHITNIPSNIKKIKINYKNKIHFIKKIPFDCIITDLNNCDSNQW